MLAPSLFYRLSDGAVKKVAVMDITSDFSTQNRLRRMRKLGTSPLGDIRLEKWVGLLLVAYSKHRSFSALSLLLMMMMMTMMIMMMMIRVSQVDAK